ncbi:GNAT family N-acetyltransferase [Desulfogranum mediterraneum]|uniref:GNAT family N-acetyltransferase n=1 Tax=Desulfogranum mediterraneum TaxID=160661 RepID=UPI00048B83D4|nr:GNAT family protein [Desulfogranum mediterraneum]
MDISKYRVYLRAFELDDYRILNKWRNDNDIYKYTGGNKYYISSEYDKRWVEEKIFDNKNNNYFGICLKDNNELIGYLSINSIDFRNRKAVWGGLVIGKKELWNIGYATEAAFIMLDYAFNELGLHSLSAVWLDLHKASIRMGEKVGFKKEGILRDRVYKSGKFFSQLSMSILREDFEKKSYSDEFEK